tara:strand:- start:6131 stop:6289 length:159 start_codon:yes stop_codon:yes gene_type:complete
MVNLVHSFSERCIYVLLYFYIYYKYFYIYDIYKKRKRIGYRVFWNGSGGVSG